MDSFEKAERKRQARGRVEAQRRRAAQLKKRAIAISAICFALLWATVFVQMATGNDPVLGRTVANAAAAAQESAGERDGPRRRSRQQIPAEAEVLGEAETSEAEAEAIEGEAAELEAAEVEAIEPEAAPEPETVTTSQS